MDSPTSMSVQVVQTGISGLFRKKRKRHDLWGGGMGCWIWEELEGRMKGKCDQNPSYASTKLLKVNENMLKNLCGHFHGWETHVLSARILAFSTHNMDWVCHSLHLMAGLPCPSRIQAILPLFDRLPTISQTLDSLLFSHTLCFSFEIAGWFLV